MRHLKTLGLAVMAAAALAAIIGASTASATVLCTETHTPCPAGKKIGPTEDSTDHWLHAVLEQGQKLYWLPTGGTTASAFVECEESTVTAESENTGSATETAKGTVTAANLTFGHCTPVGITNLKNWTFEVHWIQNTHDGTITAKETEVTLLIAGVSCIYGTGAGTDIGVLTGGSKAMMDISAVLGKTGGGFLCPSTTIWEGTYTITEPDPLYVLRE